MDGCSALIDSTGRTPSPEKQQNAKVTNIWLCGLRDLLLAKYAWTSNEIIRGSSDRCSQPIAWLAAQPATKLGQEDCTVLTSGNSSVAVQIALRPTEPQPTA